MKTTISIFFFLLFSFFLSVSAVTPLQAIVCIMADAICTDNEGALSDEEFNAWCIENCDGTRCFADNKYSNCAAWQRAVDSANEPKSAGTPKPTSPADKTGGGLFAEGLRGDIDELNKLGTNTPKILGKFIKTGLSYLGALALLIFIYGGIIWMLDTGNSERQKKGFDTLFWGGLGVAVIFASYALVSYILLAFQ